MGQPPTSCFTVMLPVLMELLGKERWGEAYTRGALSAVRDILLLANFSQHGNHYGKTYRSKIRAFNTPRVWDLCSTRPACEVAKRPECCDIYLSERASPFFTEYRSISKAHTRFTFPPYRPCLPPSCSPVRSPLLPSQQSVHGLEAIL